MKTATLAGSTSQIRHVFIGDSTSTAGAGKTALAFGDITAYYVRAGGALTSLTLVDITTLGTWDTDVTSDKLGFKLLHDTNAPGIYEIHLPDNILATGAEAVVIQLRATGAVPCNLEIQISSATRGLAGTALPDAAAEAAGGLYTRGTGAGQIAQDTNGIVRADAYHVSSDKTAADTLELFAEALDQATGKIDSGTLTDDTITANSIATGALTADAFAANALVAATFATGSLDNKGNWNVGKTGYSLTNLTVTAGTTLAAGTHTPQTGDAYAYLGTNLGANGANAHDVALSTAGLTAVENQVWDAAHGDHGGVLTFGGRVNATWTALGQVYTAMGTWTGTGVNTILGAFKAILSKVATMPSDIGGTGNPATDSLESLQEAQAIITGADGVTLATLQGNYAPAVAGDEMDLVDAPNATAVAAIQNGLATEAKQDVMDTLLDKIAVPIIGTSSGAGTGTEIFVYGGVTLTATIVGNNRTGVVFS